MEEQKLARIFNEWATRWKTNPEEFGNILDSEGNVEKDYGILCAAYFNKLNNEIN